MNYSEAIIKHKISARRVADILGICRNKISGNQLFGDKDAEKIIKDFALKFPNYGYRMITAKLRLEGINLNHKKVYRIYKKLGSITILLCNLKNLKN